MMVRACGHSIWVNTAALDRAAVTGRTPNPAGGQIDKDPDSGEPTGLLREARDIIERHIPSPTLEARKQMILAAQEDALRHGLAVCIPAKVSKSGKYLPPWKPKES